MSGATLSVLGSVPFLFLVVLPLSIVAAFLGGNMLADMQQAAHDESLCASAVYELGRHPDALAVAVDACMGIEQPTVLECVHDAASSYERHGDPESLAREMEGCGT